jgi:hypothetical protein
VGSGAVGIAQQGAAVALSADGNTAIVGGAIDNNSTGAVWVWTRTGGVWTQQGAKLVGSGAVGRAAQGASVSISADGNTAIVGGPGDNNNTGAAWIWIRAGGVWTQQGTKLVGSDAVGIGTQGSSVALSADGNTAIVGGPVDNNYPGAVWVWTRSVGVWTQQGPKLVGSGAVGLASQGGAVALSADGNTAIVGGNVDNNGTGAAWVWTRSGVVWTQQGTKLVGSGAVGTSYQGVSVALSGDGNTAIVGGSIDNDHFGATWFWTRTGGVWTQQGPKLIGGGAVASPPQGSPQQGSSVALSADGNTAIVGGPFDNSLAGAAWVFITPPVQFNLATYSAAEGDGSLVVSVFRLSDTSTAASVTYATSNGTAKEGKDYDAAQGVLNFAVGETTKTFPVLIIDNAYVDGARTVNLTLSTRSTAVLTINDNDTAVGINPLDVPRSFVQYGYYDFLGRYPDQSGWDFWTNQITSCGTNVQCIEVARINVSASFFLSIEFQNNGYLVERFYKLAFGNAIGNSTFGGAHQLTVPIVRFNEFLQDTQRIGQGVIVLAPGWEQQLESNKQDYALEFVQTVRFITAFPTTMTPAEFVDKLNTNAGNVLSPTERTTAINLFSGAGNSSNTTARAQAVRQVAEDTDLYNAEYNRAFVLAEYFGYLRRNPNDAPESTLDYTGYDFWLTKLNQFNGNYINAEMVKAFLSSIEYRQRFGP